ncbi:cytochrome P450 family protein [Rhizoctonia solani AG-3 Rhs1AP]|uniref:Cytochrome P450 family protein n=2 Tax=Rhizoctonia solani AG-3 TaxID=1086053 RepID=A0A074RMT4_9AGAM|nr:cytochrome P450 family protein [Rhizoctonia solani AG-3 Rhs1AP]KEP48386.1 cytochrome P450 family protein [Rhizoctonia solani 123E]
MDVLLTNTVAVVLVFVLITHLSYSWLLPKPIPGIPHNPVTSVLGDLPAFSHDKKNGNKLLSNFVADMIKIHGSISQILFGWHRIVIVADRNEAERITLGGKMADTTELFRSIIATALPKSQLSLPADDIWKKHRRLAGPSMSRHYLERMSGRIAFGANELVRFWNAKYALVGGTAFEADMDFHMATMDSIVNIALGESIGCIESAYSALPSTYSRSTSIAHLPHSEPPPLFTAGKVIAKAIEKALQSPFPRLSTWIFTYTSPTWWKNYNFMVSFFTSAILRAREREVELGRTDQGLSTNADCVLDMILQREKREGAESLGDQDILDELITYVFAGQDTTAAVLSWLVKYLPANPEIQRKLHEEMSTVFGQDSESNGMLDFNLLDDPERVPVLEAVVAETLRCAAVAAFIGRELLKDEIILGRLVPQGTHLFFSTEAMSKDVSLWGPDANEWRPTRWLTQDGLFNRSAGPSLPFGMGLRSCFGQRLAIYQLKMFLAIMSRTFFFKSVPPEVDTWEAVEIVTRRPRMCYVSLQKWELKKGRT